MLRVNSPGGSDTASEQILDAIRVAKANKTALVPFLLEGIGEKRELFQPDGIHPLPTAHPRILDNVWPALLPLLGGARAPSAASRVPAPAALRKTDH